MGLLDKSKNMDTTAMKTPEVTKAAVVAEKAAKPAKPVREKKIKEKKAKKARPKRVRGLPDDYQLAERVPRYISWLVNFIVNFGLIIGAIPLMMFDSGASGTPIYTWMLVGSFLVIVLNIFILPIYTKRNVGQFVSRTKYMNAMGNPANFMHGILSGMMGFLSLIGLFLVGFNAQDIAEDTTSLVYFIVGILLVIFWFVNNSFRRNSDVNQSLVDMMFAVYLVKHIPTGSETGWLLRLENLGDFGARYEKRIKAKEAKQTKKSEEEESNSSEEDLSSLTVKELKERCKTAGIEGYGSMKKDELIAALQ